MPPSRRAIAAAAAAVSREVGAPRANAAQVARQVAQERGIGPPSPAGVPGAPRLLNVDELARARAVLHRIFEASQPYLPPRAREPVWQPMWRLNRGYGLLAIAAPWSNLNTGQSTVMLAPRVLYALAHPGPQRTQYGGRRIPMFGNAVETALHEIAHTQQQPDFSEHRGIVNWTPFQPLADTPRASEGGAESFAEAVTPMVLARLGYGGERTTLRTYPDFTRFFRHRFGPGYTTRGQFQWDPTQYGQPHA